MATISLRTNRGDTDVQVTLANPGTAVTTSDFEFNFTVGQTQKLSSQELQSVLGRMGRFLLSNSDRWQGV